MRSWLRPILPALVVLLAVTALPAQAIEWTPRRPPSTSASGDDHAAQQAAERARHRAEAARQARQRAARAARARAVSAWSGYAFDACKAPSSRAMDRWRVSSPFLGVGIYIGGSLRACSQKNLSRRWVSRQTARGWRMLPLWVGPQATCSRYGARISTHPRAAEHQGARAARGARAAARRLGIPSGSVLWYDLEWFPTGRAHCKRTALRFLGAWTRSLHRHGYRSGVYSSVSAGIKVLGRVRGSRHYAHPDAVWFAWANRRRDSWLGRDWLDAPRWKSHRRVHQFSLNDRPSYGGVRISIDRNYVDLGSSPALRRMPAVCGRAADRRHYRDLRRHDRGALVRTARCLLQVKGDGAFDGRMKAAVRRVQRRAHLPRTGRIGTRTWVAMLARGPHPVLKRGSEGPAVRRLQRSLTAALPGSVTVHGHFGPATSAAVQRYQRRNRLNVTAVAGPKTWRHLAHGRPGRRR